MRRTSVIAYNAIAESGELSRARKLVYDTLRDQGPMTGAELDAFLTQTGGRGHYHKRLSELQDFGMVRIVFNGARPCKVTGHLAEVWEALANRPVTEDRTKRPTKKQIRFALTFILERCTTIIADESVPPGVRTSRKVVAQG